MPCPPCLFCTAHANALPALSYFSRVPASHVHTKGGAPRWARIGVHGIEVCACPLAQHERTLADARTRFANMRGSTALAATVRPLEAEWSTLQVGAR